MKALKPEELAELAAFVARQGNLAWDAQIDGDFSLAGKSTPALQKIDARIDVGDFTLMP